MRYKVVFRREARDEAVEAAAYLLEHAGPVVAERWYQALASALASLSSMPRRCPLAREHEAFPGIELRQLNFMSHRLIFTIRKREVHVLHIRHVAQENLPGQSN